MEQTIPVMPAATPAEAPTEAPTEAPAEASTQKPAMAGPEGYFLRVDVGYATLLLDPETGKPIGQDTGMYVFDEHSVSSFTPFFSSDGLPTELLLMLFTAVLREWFEVDPKLYAATMVQFCQTIATAKISFPGLDAANGDGDPAPEQGELSFGDNGVNEIQLAFPFADFEGVDANAQA